MSKSEKVHISVTFINNYFLIEFFQLFHRIRNQHQILHFLTPILHFWKNKFFGDHNSTFVNFEVKRNDSQKRKTHFINVSTVWENQVVKSLYHNIHVTQIFTKMTQLWQILFLYLGCPYKVFSASTLGPACIENWFFPCFIISMLSRISKFQAHKRVAAQLRVWHS